MPRKAGAADRKRIVANWRNGMKSREEAEGGGESVLRHALARRDAGRGRCPPGLLPAATSAAALELRREPKRCC